MTRVISKVARCTRHPRLYRCYSSGTHHRVPQVQTVQQSLNSIDLEDFRKHAFVPELPLLMKAQPTDHALLIAGKWFSDSLDYLRQYSDTIVPYEHYTPLDTPSQNSAPDIHGVRKFLQTIKEQSPDSQFHRFNDKLSLFLNALILKKYVQPRLYIAQAKLSDLPPDLRADLPTPDLVLKAGKGDIYDANLWMGLPPTYTPLHKDPNPNLFLQLKSRKLVRLFPPKAGLEIFRRVQMEIGGQASSTFRGDEMMAGPEYQALKEAVWQRRCPGYVQADLKAGDALFIPKGWWHTVKSNAEGVNASVNWWFR